MRRIPPLVIPLLLMAYPIHASSSAVPENRVLETDTPTVEATAEDEASVADPDPSRYESGYRIPFVTDRLGIRWAPALEKRRAERSQYCWDAMAPPGHACR